MELPTLPLKFRFRRDVLRGVREHKAAREHLRRTFTRQLAEREERIKLDKKGVK
jgi:hypothetical protein